MGQKFTNQERTNAGKAIFAKHTSLAANARAGAEKAEAKAQAEAKAAANQAAEAQAKANATARAAKIAENRAKANATARAAQAAANANRRAQEAQVEAERVKKDADAKMSAAAEANAVTRRNALLAEATAAQATRAQALLAEASRVTLSNAKRREIANKAAAALAGPSAKSNTATMRQAAALIWLNKAWPHSGQKLGPRGYKEPKENNASIFKAAGYPQEMNFFAENVNNAANRWNPPKNGIFGGRVINANARKKRIVNLARNWAKHAQKK
jgi:colicin import membrane protein